MQLPIELDYLATAPELKKQGKFIYADVSASVEGEFCQTSDPIYSALIKGHLPKGLYRHQLEALDLIENQNNVVIATSTSSGKSLCYQLPIAKAILSSKKRSQRPKALVIHPTKSLANDQLRSWSQLNLSSILVATFDGDSSYEHRVATRRFADVWLTNPEMINSAILANHGKYGSLLGALSFIVIDEAHVYRGVFGSHLALLLRRLIRIAKMYGSNPQFIFTSATISDPGEICSKLINQKVMTIEKDSSPKPVRTLAIFQTKILDAQQGNRASYSRAAATISVQMSQHGHRVITFVRSRRLSELLANQARQLLGNPDNQFSVLSYRGGYLAIQRREIEQMVTEGICQILVATSAMELGVDISILDSAVVTGFPGTFSSFRQQIGRVGRDDRPSTSVLVCGPDGLDQWIASNPSSLTDRPVEKAVINPLNPYILRSHLRAACYESPLSPEELSTFAPTADIPLVQSELEVLVANGDISIRNGKYATNLDSPPHTEISMRSSGGKQVLISTSEGELIGTAEFPRAQSTLFEGSIYLHLGQSFKTISLDLERSVALVEPYFGSEQTWAIFDTTYTNFQPERKTEFPGISLSLGRTTITETVKGYQTLTADGEALSVSQLDMPPSILDTRAFWFDFYPESLIGIESGDLPGALHGAEHAMISMMPIFAICDRSDIGGVSRLHVPDPFSFAHDSESVASITIYDGYPGGIGIAELGYSSAIEIAKATLQMVSSCSCGNGCPSCIQSPKCGNLNSPLSKDGTIKLLGSIIDRCETKV
jgi:DEAD/DEAH box helicase domain-containing protein